MLEKVMEAVISGLTASGINARREYGMTQAGEQDDTAVCVGIEQSVLKSSGCGEYLGTAPDGGAGAEVYGFRAEVTVGFDIFSADAPSGAECWDRICKALDESPPGLKVRSLFCGGAAYDELTGLIRRKCRADCTAYLIRSADGETGEFTDFVLKGVLRSER